jgi:hypothetical protein
MIEFLWLVNLSNVEMLKDQKIFKKTSWYIFEQMNITHSWRGI